MWLEAGTETPLILSGNHGNTSPDKVWFIKSCDFMIKFIFSDVLSSDISSPIKSRTEDSSSKVVFSFEDYIFSWHCFQYSWNTCNNMDLCWHSYHVDQFQSTKIMVNINDLYPYLCNCLSQGLSGWSTQVSIFVQSSFLISFSSLTSSTCCSSTSSWPGTEQDVWALHWTGFGDMSLISKRTVF